MRQLSAIFLIYVVLSPVYYQTHAAKSNMYIKLTNAHCESFNKSWAVVNECRLRAIKRDVAVLNINISLLHTANDMHLRIAFLKKANGYKPFVLNATVDFCEYMRKRSNPIANLVYPFFAPFSNLNHSCPYVGDQIVKNFYPMNELIRLFYPPGDYLLLLSWIFNKKATIVTNVYFTFFG